MSSKTAKSDKVLQEKLQALLSHLLREEDNKYCADCDAKGPRWAAWNLGIFVCIRCAGIHRNLGVHISRVKSVNLDSWTSEQVGSMQSMGNSKGRAVYEASLPDGFRRPQADSALEGFIRSKYEHKKYIAREWIPPATIPKADLSVLGGAPAATTAKTSPIQKAKIELNTSVPRPHSTNNLQDAAHSPVSQTLHLSASSDDLFQDFISAPLPNSVPATANDPSVKNCTPISSKPATLSPDSEEKDFFNQVSSGNTVNSSTQNSSSKIDKESIMSLYAKAPPGGISVQHNPLLQGGVHPHLNLGAPGLPINTQMAQNNPFLMGANMMPPVQNVHMAHHMGGPVQNAQVPPHMGMQGFMMSPPTGVLGHHMPPMPAGMPPMMSANVGVPLSGGGAATNFINGQMSALHLGGQAKPLSGMNGSSGHPENLWN